MAIPRTDLEITRIGYGCGSFGGAWDREPVTDDAAAQARRVMGSVDELGLNFFDVAAAYAYGKSEAAMGRALKEMPSLRGRIVLQSKLGIVLPDSLELFSPAADDPYYLDSSREHILASVESSLRRLGTDYLDILLIHRPDILMEPDEIAEAFDRLHQAGKVRYFGLSNFSPAQTEHLRRSLRQPIVTNQLRFGLGHPYLVTDGFDFNRVGPKRTDALTAGTDGALEYFQANGILIQAWSPLQGTFGDARWDEHPNRLKRLLPELDAVATAYGTTADAIALAWVLRHPSGMVPIIGTQNSQRLLSYRDALELRLERRDWYRLLYAAYDRSAPALHQG